MFFITFLRNGVVKNIRNDIYEQMIKLSLSFYSEKKRGDIVARISSDVQELDNSFLSIFELIVKDPLMVLFTLISMFLISPKLSLFVIIFISIIIDKKKKNINHLYVAAPGILEESLEIVPMTVTLCPFSYSMSLTKL